MATPVTFNGVVYSIPAFGDTGYSQGSGNLSSYLIALAGGPFPYISQTVNPASAGTMRLANTDTIDWRNFNNTGNLPLAVNASNQLTFNGTPVGVGGVSSITGTANEIIASSSTGAITLSTPQPIAPSSSPSFNALILTNAGPVRFKDFTNTNEVDISAPTSVTATYNLMLPSTQGGVNTFLKNDGVGNLTWSSAGNSPSYQQFYELVEHDLTATTYTNVGSVAVSLAASSNTAAIKLTVSTVVQNLTADQTVNTTISVDGTNITVLLPGGSSKALSTSQAHSVTQISQICYSIVYVPGDTSSHTYQLQAQASSASTYAIGSNGNATTLIAEEIH